MKDKRMQSTERISYHISSCFAIKQATEQMNVQLKYAKTEEEKEDLRNQLKDTLDLLK